MKFGLPIRVLYSSILWQVGGGGSLSSEVGKVGWWFCGLSRRLRWASGVGLPFEVLKVGWWVVVEEESVVLVGQWAFLLRL